MPSLWTPTTWGEELFLNLYDDLGSKVSTSGPADIGLDFLINAPAFANFSRIAATSEVFTRCLRSGMATYKQTPEARPELFARNLRLDVDLPTRLFRNLKFGERLRQASQIAVEKKRNDQIERNATKDLPPVCYLCGIALTKAHNTHSKRTVDHLWPIAFGGQTVEGNLLLACADCNSKRGDFATWAMGPVHSTRFVQSSNNEATHTPNETLRFSLGLARVLSAAQPLGKRREPMTLREASIMVCPAIPTLKLTQDRIYTYFELIEHLEVSL